MPRRSDRPVRGLPSCPGTMTGGRRTTNVAVRMRRGTDLYFAPMARDRTDEAAWELVRERLHAEGLRWTPQRRTLVDVLSQTDGHVTGSELVERCRELSTRPRRHRRSIARSTSSRTSATSATTTASTAARNTTSSRPMSTAISIAAPAAARGRSSPARPTRSRRCSTRGGPSRWTARTSRSPGAAQRAPRPIPRGRRRRRGTASGPSAHRSNGHRWYRWTWPNLLTLRTGDPPPGANRGATATANPRRARQLTSQAKRAASRYVVLRPSIHPSPTQRAVGRNLALDLVAAVGVGVSMALVTTLLPTIARRGGLEPMGLAALAAAPFIANLLGVFAGRFGPRSPASWRSSAASGPRPRRPVHRADAADHGRRLGRVLGQPVVRRPVPPAPVGRDVPGPTSRPDRRGHRHGSGGRRRRWRPSPAGSSPTARRAARPSRSPGSSALAVPIALHRASVRRPPSDRRVFSARDSIRALRERPVLGRVALAQGFYGGGLIAALPLYALVLRRPARPVARRRRHHRHPDGGLDDGLVHGLGRRERPLRGDRRDAHRQRDGPRGPDRRAPRPDVPLLWVAAVAAGAASASIDVGIAVVVSEHTPLPPARAAMAGWNAITGARGIVAAFLMSALLQAGIVDVTTGLLLCARRDRDRGRALRATGTMPAATVDRRCRLG